MRHGSAILGRKEKTRIGNCAVIYTLKLQLEHPRILLQLCVDLIFLIIVWLCIVYYSNFYRPPNPIEFLAAFLLKNKDIVEEFAVTEESASTAAKTLETPAQPSAST